MRTGSISRSDRDLLQAKKVGVVRGGLSAERRISLRSGRAVTRALKRVGIAAFPVDPADRRAFSQKIRAADILFIALHGKGGEDGALQKALERKGILFTGASSAACRKSFNKHISKQYFRALGVPTPAYAILDKTNWRSRAASFPAPYFVKPLDGGSSQGVFLVEDFRKSAEKLRRSVLRFGKVLIEKKIVGRELTAGLLGDLKLPVVEVKPSRPFYDYKAKYTKGMTVYEVPARIPARVAQKVQKIAYRVYRGLGLRGFSRVDVMLDRRNRPYVLEVNSIPGLTEFSLLPKAARAIGIGFEELCMRVLLEAHKRKKKR
ncbi:MAG TPA: D-alanine--D-alanine ligase [Candidatus Omnitrophota bacterium]|nr:D-alanine--D-alanine ligase [Candidatus Omnitrophota bacterium]